MIEKTVLDWLAGALDVPVVMEVPETVPASLVVIEKTGSGEEDTLLSATLAIQSYAATLHGAAALNEAVKAAMGGLPALPNVFRCHCQTDYNWTDTRTKRRRYQAVFDIFYTEEE